MGGLAGRPWGSDDRLWMLYEVLYGSTVIDELFSMTERVTESTALQNIAHYWCALAEMFCDPVRLPNEQPLSTIRTSYKRVIGAIGKPEFFFG